MINSRKWKKASFMIVLFLFVLAVTACSGIQKESPSVKNERNQAPSAVSFQLEGVGNRTLDSSKVNKPMVLSFWATWCSYCREEMPIIDSLYREYEGKVEFAAVNLTHLDSVESVEHYVKEEQLHLPVYFDHDGKVTGQFRVISTPTVVLLDPQGIEVYRKVGAGGKDSANAYRQQLDSMLADKQPQEGG